MADLQGLNTRTATSRVELLDPAGRELLDDSGERMWIAVRSLDSDEYRSVERELIDERLKRAASAGKVDQTITAEEVERRALDRLARCTSDWSIQLGGECPALTLESALALYRDYPWIAEQVAKVIEDRAAFFGASSTG